MRLAAYSRAIEDSQPAVGELRTLSYSPSHSGMRRAARRPFGHGRGFRVQGWLHAERSGGTSVKGCLY